MTTEIAGALVDSSSVTKLTHAIENYTLETAQTRQALHRLNANLEEIGDQLRELRSNIQRVGDILLTRK